MRVVFCTQDVTYGAHVRDLGGPRRQPHQVRVKRVNPHALVRGPLLYQAETALVRQDPIKVLGPALPARCLGRRALRRDRSNVAEELRHRLIVNRCTFVNALRGLPHLLHDPRTADDVVPFGIITVHGGHPLATLYPPSRRVKRVVDFHDRVAGVVHGLTQGREQRIPPLCVVARLPRHPEFRRRLFASASVDGSPAAHGVAVRRGHRGVTAEEGPTNPSAPPTFVQCPRPAARLCQQAAPTADRIPSLAALTLLVRLRTLPFRQRRLSRARPHFLRPHRLGGPSREILL